MGKHDKPSLLRPKAPNVCVVQDLNNCGADSKAYTMLLPRVRKSYSSIFDGSSSQGECDGGGAQKLSWIQENCI